MGLVRSRFMAGTARASPMRHEPARRRPHLHDGAAGASVRSIASGAAGAGVHGVDDHLADIGRDGVVLDEPHLLRQRGVVVLAALLGNRRHAPVRGNLGDLLERAARGAVDRLPR